jgi:hypothetical protein
MRKLSAIFLVVIFAMSLLICSCSASGGVSIGKQQSTKTVNTEQIK